MGVQVGGDAIRGAYVGSIAVRAIYVGSTKVWPTTPVLAPPGVPRNFRVTAPSGYTTALDADWDAPSSGGAVANYRVQWRASGQQSWSERTVTGNSIRLSSLGPGVAYQVRVRAENASGNSGYTAAVTASTNPAIPPVPTGLAAVAGDQRIAVSWNAAARATSYDLRYREGTFGDWTTISGIAGTSRTITGLTNSQAYRIQVRARNATGASAYASPVTATPSEPLAAPGLPRSLAAAGRYARVVLSWLAPTSGGAPASYEIRHRRTNQNPADSGTQINGITGTSRTITGLTNGQEREFQIRARNSAGASAWTASATATPLDVPNIPTGLAVAPGNAAVALSWTAPASGGAVASYEVDYRLSSAQSWTSITGITTTSRTVTGLTNGLAYNFRVRSRNASGASGWTATVNATPTAARANAPTALVVTPVSMALRLSWTLPVAGGATRTGWEIQYKLQSASNWSTAPAPPVNANSTAIASLTNGQVYDVRIRAVTATSGQESDWLTGSGTPAVPSDELTALAVEGVDLGVEGVDLFIGRESAPVDKMPTFGNASIANQSWVANVAITNLVLPQASGGDGALVYSLSPALPSGLTFTAGTRTISGTPSAAAGAATYTYTVTDADGDTATLSFTITVTAVVLVAPGPPRNVNADAGDTQIAISWDAPDGGG
ncbi:MAG: fibronectin type III domain-containing protein, partial [Acidobacteria bacterium]|nr:fibronectin type III domain-containing protein [Acidobacteriota bacterium]